MSNITTTKVFTSENAQAVQIPRQFCLEDGEVYISRDDEKILAALDAKIENNRKINHHLEQMAQAIFKSWFVDFKPFEGEMPGDWREVPLGVVVEMSTKALNPQSCPDTILEHYSIPAFDETRLPVFETLQYRRVLHIQ